MKQINNNKQLIKHKFNNGLTVKELKELIKDWPEKNQYAEDCEVWVEIGKGLRSPVTLVSPLNIKNDDGIISADIIFETNTFNK